MEGEVASLNLVFVGWVVKRKILNKGLGFFHIDVHGEVIQVKIKAIDLPVCEESSKERLIYSAGPPVDIPSWRVNVIKVGSKIEIHGTTERTNRGTDRIKANRIDLYLEETLEETRNLSTGSHNDVLCNIWSRKVYYDQVEEEKEFLEEWNVLLPCADSCQSRHHWISKNEKESVFIHLTRLCDQLRKEWDPANPFSHKGDGVSRTRRAQVLADWIYDKISEMGWSSICIIDVAGGSGCLLKELLVRFHSICRLAVLIEPDTRKEGSDSMRRKVNQRVKMLSKEVKKESLIDTNNNTSHSKEEVDSAGDCREEEESLACEIRFYAELFNKEFYHDPTHSHLFQHDTIIVGLHPDQATEPIVDCALYHNISRVIVPCCVFADESPWRRIIRGNVEIPVRTYSEFIEYLEVKYKLHCDYLPLQGRNKLLYALSSQ